MTEPAAWTAQHDEHGNYLVDPNGNQVACIYEMAVVGALLNVLNGPTTAMVEAGEDCGDWGPSGYFDHPNGEATAEKAYKAMIKAAFE